MHIDPVWRPWTSDLSEAKAPVESIKIIFPPAAPIPPHPFQQLSITIGHATLPFSQRRELLTVPDLSTYIIWQTNERLVLRTANGQKLTSVSP